jgi:Cys-tRNA(Pro)/Cys-tRNA(Cys) deacylase
MAKKRSGGGTPATVALDRAGVTYRLLPYDHDPRAHSFGLEAVAALGVDPDRVFKTLLASLDGSLVVGLVPVSDQLDLKALARALGGSKAVMAEVADAERVTGYVAGGISPVGQKRRLRTVLDSSALDHPTIYVSGGRRGLELEIGPADLVAITEAITDRVRAQPVRRAAPASGEEVEGPGPP